LASYQARVTLVLLIVHLVGWVGLAYFRDFFLPITPFQLLFVTALLLSDHRDWRPRFATFAGTVITAGLAIEIAGVQTGVIFGSYRYTEVFGPAIGGVPLLIGLNWLLLTYLTARASTYLVWHPVLTPLAGAALMLALDLMLEPVAIELGFWVWSDGLPPWQNYLAWFLTAWAFHMLAWHLKVYLRSRVAMPLLIIQALFFLSILLTA
jgi:putative membrane protein